MAIQDKAITIKGTLTAVASITLYPQADGSVIITAQGSTKDSLGNTVTLNEARLQVTGVAVIDNMIARALNELRKANGLEA